VIAQTRYTTEALAEFALGLRPDDIPAATVEAVQRCILDLVGSAVAGAGSEAAVIARGCAERLGGPGRATVWFGGENRQPAYAAFANSAAASALDLDDGHRAGGGHPGAAVIPAVLAVAQQVGAVWPEALAALVAGYEVGVRVSAARDFASLDTLATGRWCAYGVAAAAGRLQQLSARKTAHAVALAGILSPGLSAAGYSRLMGNHAKEGIPWATLTGLWAVELAAGGFVGPLDILDHRNYFDPDLITGGLGRRLRIEDTYFKPYACCRWIHGALDGVIDLMRAHDLPTGDIRAIEVHTFERALRLNNYPDPDSVESAQYSLPFCVAAVAIEGARGLLPLRGSTLHRPDIVALAGRVSLHVDEGLDRMFPERTAARVVVRTGSREVERVCHNPLGDPANPMDWEMLVGKFQQLAQGILTEKQTRHFVQAVESLPDEGLSTLLGLLAA
jgi:2-methylcitrate dehydratase PrpD